MNDGLLLKPLSTGFMDTNMKKKIHEKDGFLVVLRSYKKSHHISSIFVLQHFLPIACSTMY